MVCKQSKIPKPTFVNRKDVEHDYLYVILVFSFNGLCPDLSYLNLKYFFRVWKSNIKH